MPQLAVDANTVIAFTLALLAGAAGGLIGYLISRVLAPPKPYPLKYERFESGNPPTKRGRGWFTMEYYAYLVIFLTVEPVFIYLFLLLMEARAQFFTVASLFGLIILMLIPPLVFGLDAARRIELWRIREKEK